MPCASSCPCFQSMVSFPETCGLHQIFTIGHAFTTTHLVKGALRIMEEIRGAGDSFGSNPLPCPAILTFETHNWGGQARSKSIGQSAGPGALLSPVPELGRGRFYGDTYNCHLPESPLLGRSQCKRRVAADLTWGAAFDLIVGHQHTGRHHCVRASSRRSAAGTWSIFYRKHGRFIFGRNAFPKGIGPWGSLCSGGHATKRVGARGTEVLRRALAQCLGDITIGQL